MAATKLLSDNGVTSGITGYQLTGGNDGTLQLQTTTAGGTATTAMTIDTSQNVGIGTSSPSYPVDVYSAASGIVRVKGGSSSGQGGAFFVGAATSGSTLSAFGDWARINGGTVDQATAVYSVSSAPMIFAVGSERMRIDTSGNVGIGIAPTNTSLSLAQAKNLSWQWASNGYNYANIFNQTSSAALILASGYQQSATANGFASSVPVSWDRSALKVSSGGISLYTDTPATVAVGTDITPTERVRLDSSGRMRVIYQPSFSAYSPAVTGSGLIVKYTSTRSNVGSCYDTSTGVFTAPIAGVYVFSFNSLMNVNGDYVRLLFRWNGTVSTTYGDTLSGGTMATAWAGWSYISIGMSWVVSLGQGDTVSVWNDGPCTTWGTGYGTFSGYMLG